MYDEMMAHVCAGLIVNWWRARLDERVFVKKSCMRGIESSGSCWLGFALSEFRERTRWLPGVLVCSLRGRRWMLDR